MKLPVIKSCRACRFLAFSAWLFILACNDKVVSSKNSEDRIQLDSLSLASLEKVADYPMYAMTYYGDYGFADYLRTGNWDGLSSQDPAWDDHGWACTCFAAIGTQRQPLLGRNFDWHDCIPLLLYTDPPDGYASVSVVDLEYFGFYRNNLPDATENRQRLLQTPFMPFDGLNEMGVAIGMMAVPSARAPFDAHKVTIGEIQVIRLVLDYAKNVAEAIELIKKYNVRMENPPIHYLIADAAGNSVIIEFVNGQMIVMRNHEDWQVSTNFIIHGSTAPQNVTCWRYQKAYQNLKSASGNLTSAAAMGLLQQVSQSNTIWSTLYQLKPCELSLAVGARYGSVKNFKLKKN